MILPVRSDEFDDLSWLTEAQIDELAQIPPKEREGVLVELFNQRLDADTSFANSYERHKSNARDRQRRQTAKGQDVGPIP